MLTQVAFMEDTREQYSEMRDEFFASLEDRRYLTISEARSKGLKVGHGPKQTSIVCCCRPALRLRLRKYRGHQHHKSRRLLSDELRRCQGLP
jgi:hypothetical protein